MRPTGPARRVRRGSSSDRGRGVGVRPARLARVPAPLRRPPLVRAAASAPAGGRGPAAVRPGRRHRPQLPRRRHRPQRPQAQEIRLHGLQPVSTQILGTGWEFFPRPAGDFHPLLGI